MYEKIYKMNCLECDSTFYQNVFGNEFLLNYLFSQQYVLRNHLLENITVETVLLSQLTDYESLKDEIQPQNQTHLHRNQLH